MIGDFKMLCRNYTLDIGGSKCNYIIEIIKFYIFQFEK